MNRLATIWRRLPAWAWPWLLTALAAVTGMAAALWLSPLWRAQAESDLAAAARTEQQRAAARKQQTTSVFAWREQLPSASERDARLAALLDAALQADVTLQSADQAGPEATTKGLSQQRINLSLRGSYVQLRRFVERVLQADAGLVVERISFSRSKAEDSQIDAHVQISLLQREPVGAAP